MYPHGKSSEVINDLSFLSAAALNQVIGDDFLTLKILKLLMIHACSKCLP